MLLTAQRVRHPSGQEGINAFFSVHGPYTWFGPPPPGVPDANPGQRVHERVSVPAGGNLVRSYLDVVAPDETPTSEILASIPRFIESVRQQPLPWSGTVGRCMFRFAVDATLAGSWLLEFDQLLRAALGVRTPV